jgi:hypothetical protein
MMFDSERLGTALTAGGLALLGLGFACLGGLSLPIWLAVIIVIVCLVAGYLGGEWVVDLLRQWIDWS